MKASTLSTIATAIATSNSLFIPFFQKDGVDVMRDLGDVDDVAADAIERARSGPEAKAVLRPARQKRPW